MKNELDGIPTEAPKVAARNVSWINDVLNGLLHKQEFPDKWKVGYYFSLKKSEHQRNPINSAQYIRQIMAKKSSEEIE